MKVIELLNKIANGDEVPEKIFYSDKIWYWDPKVDDYTEDYKRLFNYYLVDCLISCLNDEVEIIEEDKKIEMLELSNATINEQEIEFKINEIIDVINKGGDKSD